MTPWEALFYSARNLHVSSEHIFIFGICQRFYLVNSFSFYKSLLVDASPGCINYFVLCPARHHFLPECQHFSFSLSNQNSLLFVIPRALASSLRFSAYIFWSLLIHFGFFVCLFALFVFKSVFFFFFLRAKVLCSLGWFWICSVAKDNHELLSLPPPPDCRDCRCVLYLISFSAVAQTQGLGMAGKHSANCQPQPLLLFIGGGVSLWSLGWPWTHNFTTPPESWDYNQACTPIAIL